MNKNRGFYLVEMIVVLSILPVIMVVTGKLFLSFSQTMPQSDRTIAQHTTLQHMLTQLGEDIDGADQASISMFDGRPDLMIKNNQGTWNYRTTDQGVVRALQGQEQTRTWHLPQAHVQWQIVEPYPQCMALAVQTSIQYTHHGRLQTKLAQTRMFFLPPKVAKEVSP